MDTFLKIFLTVAGAAALGAAVVFMAVVQPGGDGVVAAIRLPDGAEYMVHQRCNWGAEPYTVALYTREKGGPWSWSYVDHESMRWRGSAMTYDAVTDRVTLTEKGVVRGVIDRPAKQFRLHGMGDRDFPQQAGVTPPNPFPL